MIYSILHVHVVFSFNILGYEPISSNGTGSPPPKAVLCVAGLVMLSFHGSFKIFESYRTLQSVISNGQSGIIRHPASRSLLASQGNLGYHIHIFNVSIYEH